MNKDRTAATSSGVPVTRPQPAAYDFRMDADLTKYVSVDQLGDLVTVRVRYADDAVLQDETHRLRTSGRVEITTDAVGLKVSYVTAYLFGLIRWQRTARF